MIGALLVLGAALWRWRAPETAASGDDSSSAAAVRPAPSGEVRREPGLDVLLITVDTLRADALGSYGRAAGTPWMDRLAREGVRFDDAHAHNALTLPSHANILTALYPVEHGVRDNSGFRLPRDVGTLAGLLAAAGYRTAAFVSAFPLDSRFGLARGFEVYEDSFLDAASRPAFLEHERAGSETVALAREWLAAADPRPSFAWVHLYEPHFPYAPPEPWASRFAAAPYQGEVAAADAALGPLLEPILAAGAGAETLVVLTSDHGESLGEHGEATHGIFAYEGVLKVPLILYQPRLLPPRVVDAPARHVDLMPTILDALALEVPAGLRGRSLLAAAVGQRETESVEVYFEALSGQLNRGWAPLYGVIDRGWKYIELPIHELYDLASDPQESRNLAGSEPERLAAARAVLEPLRRSDPGSAPSRESAEVLQRLSALGYLGGGGSAAPREYTAEDDPKTLIGLDAALREIATLYATGDLGGALRESRELVRRRPDMRVALLHLAQLERESGNLEAAVAAQQRALALQPDDHSALALLASYLIQAGREADAVSATEPHARLAEPDVEVLLTRGLALARLRRPREAWEAFQRAGSIDPSNPKVAVYVGTFHLMGGQRERARAAYEQALALNPATAAAHSALAIMAIEEGDVEESLAHWRQALASDRREHAKLAKIGTDLWSAGRLDEARSLLELFVVAAPPTEYGDDLERARKLLASSGAPRRPT